MCAVAVHVAGVRLFTFIVIQVDSKIQSVCISCMHPQIYLRVHTVMIMNQYSPHHFSVLRGEGLVSYRRSKEMLSVKPFDGSLLNS